MRIAIISDVHNNETNLKKVLDFCVEKSASRRIEKIICCGDLASQEMLDLLCDNFPDEIYYVFGNMDGGHLCELLNEKTYKNVQIFQDFGETEIKGNKIAFTHYPNTAKKLAQTEKYKFIFYGHTHKPWTENILNSTLLNPGNVAGEIYPPTFAIWDVDEDNFKLIRVHDLK